jgi:hypothetical protein
MRRVLFLLMAFSVVLLSGCVPAQLQKREARIPFNEDEYKQLPKVGTAVVRGQAFLKTRGGDVKTAAGSEVVLNPVTSYSLDWYGRGYLQGVRLEPSDTRLAAYMKTQTADGSGRFTFKNVPPGEYFVTTTVTWEVPDSSGYGMNTQGGSVTKRIKVADGDDIDVILTR